MVEHQRQSIPLPALILGVGGLLPFAISALLVVFPTLSAAFLPVSLIKNENRLMFSTLALGAYGAVILSFLGGVRWGNLLSDQARLQQWLPLSLSVLPSLIAWPALLLGAPSMLVVLIGGFALQYFLDARAVALGDLPVWFGRLRLLLTSGAIACLLVGLVAVLP